MASDVFPDPDTPTTATVRHSGTSTSTSCRLFVPRPAHADDRGRVSGTRISLAATTRQPKASISGCCARARAGVWPAPVRAVKGGQGGRGRCVRGEAPRLHDLGTSWVGEDLDVRGGQHAVYFAMTGAAARSVTASRWALPRPGVPRPLCKGHRVDRGQRLCALASMSAMYCWWIARFIAVASRPRCPLMRWSTGRNSAMAGRPDPMTSSDRSGCSMAPIRRDQSMNIKVSWSGSGCRCCPECGWVLARPARRARRRTCRGVPVGEVISGNAGPGRRRAAAAAGSPRARCGPRPRRTATAAPAWSRDDGSRPGVTVLLTPWRRRSRHGPLQVAADGRRRVEQDHAVRGCQDADW